METQTPETIQETPEVKKDHKVRDWLRKFPLKAFLCLTLAGIVNAFGVTVFLMPVSIYDSGMSGASMFLSQVTPGWLSLSTFLVVLNMPLFLYGMKKQGGSFTARAIYAVGVYSVVAFLITDVLPIDVSLASPLAGTDLLLCALFGGIISWVGSGLAIRYGGAMDGIEVLAVIFAKGLGLSVGTFVMIFNCVLYILCGVVMDSWILPLYSIVTYFAALKTLDFIVEGLNRSKAAFIVTTKPQQVCKALGNTFGSAGTSMEAKGGYLGNRRAMIYFVVNRFQIGHVRDVVHDVDPGAYITISEVADIFAANRDRD